MRAKPWEAFGMSRATWYRKGKSSTQPKQSRSEARLPPQ